MKRVHIPAGWKRKCKKKNNGFCSTDFPVCLLESLRTQRRPVWSQVQKLLQAQLLLSPVRHSGTLLRLSGHGSSSLSPVLSWLSERKAGGFSKCWLHCSSVNRSPEAKVKAWTVGLALCCSVLRDHSQMRKFPMWECCVNLAPLSYSPPAFLAKWLQFVEPFLRAFFPDPLRGASLSTP